MQYSIIQNIVSELDTMLRCTEQILELVCLFFCLQACSVYHQVYVNNCDQIYYLHCSHAYSESSVESDSITYIDA